VKWWSTCGPFKGTGPILDFEDVNMKNGTWGGDKLAVTNIEIHLFIVFFLGMENAVNKSTAVWR
jgi:hypothetical protein